MRIKNETTTVGDDYGCKGVAKGNRPKQRRSCIGFMRLTVVQTLIYTDISFAWNVPVQRFVLKTP